MSDNFPREKKKWSKPNGWIIARRLTQAVSLTVLIVFLVFARPDGLPNDISNLPIRISPLAMLAQWFSSRTFLVGMSVSLVLLLSSLIFGRAWCGWLCPLGTILDIFKFRRFSNNKTPPEKLRSIKYGLLFTILIAAAFTNLTLIIFDPLTIFTRAFTMTILPALDRIIIAVERILIQVPFLREGVFKFDQVLRPAILPSSPVVFQYSILLGLFFTGILLLNFFAELFWCRYLCPLGAMLGLPSKISLFQRKIKESCVSCGLCEPNCPTGTIDPKKGFASDPSECTLCMKCLESCQKDSLDFSPRLRISKLNQYDPGRRTFLSALGLSIAAIAILAVDWVKKVPRNHFILPPGADYELFSSKCIRCGLCIKICPTNALQPDINQTGLGAVLSPILVPRIGFCQFSCNACGQECPVEAIHPLFLDEKQTTVIGKAYIDQNRCIAWADHQNCIVCEEMCPLPEKAITLETGQFLTTDGGNVEVLLPVVNRTTCIGCGICENKCPVVGEAAIRVYSY